jgi:hypothetical protein
MVIRILHLSLLFDDYYLYEWILTGFLKISGYFKRLYKNILHYLNPGYLSTRFRHYRI